MQRDIRAQVDHAMQLVLERVCMVRRCNEDDVISFDGRKGPYRLAWPGQGERTEGLLNGSELIA